MLEPYLFYNFIYRSTTLSEPLTTKPEIALSLGYYGSTTYVSMEHHFGIGLKMKRY